MIMAPGTSIQIKGSRILGIDGRLWQFYFINDEWVGHSLEGNHHAYLMSHSRGFIDVNGVVNFQSVGRDDMKTDMAAFEWGKYVNVGIKRGGQVVHSNGDDYLPVGLRPATAIAVSGSSCVILQDNGSVVTLFGRGSEGRIADQPDLEDVVRIRMWGEDDSGDDDIAATVAAITSGGQLVIWGKVTVPVGFSDLLNPGVLPPRNLAQPQQNLN